MISQQQMQRLDHTGQEFVEIEDLRSIHTNFLPTRSSLLGDRC